jgi:Abortive infection alpha
VGLRRGVRKVPKSKPKNGNAGPNQGPAIAKTLINGLPQAIKGIAPEAARAASKELVPLGVETGKTLNAAGLLILRPLKGLIWGGDKICDFIQDKVQSRLKDVPEVEIQEPDPQISGPTLEALRYCGHKDELADMFAALIANSMDKRFASNSHPSFVKIIEQMTTDEAIFFKKMDIGSPHAIADIIMRTNISTGEYKILLSSVIPEEIFDWPATQIRNTLVPSLERFGIVRVEYDAKLTNSEHYEKIRNQDKRFQSQFNEIELKEYLYRATPIGIQLQNIIRGK